MTTEKKNAESTFATKDQIRAAADYGIDISMLSENIKRSYTERIRRHQIALNTAEKLRKAKRK